MRPERKSICLHACTNDVTTDQSEFSVKFLVENCGTKSPSPVHAVHVLSPSTITSLTRIYSNLITHVHVSFLRLGGASANRTF